VYSINRRMLTPQLFRTGILSKPEQYEPLGAQLRPLMAHMCALCGLKTQRLQLLVCFTTASRHRQRASQQGTQSPLKQLTDARPEW
jgi:hypothetical protein